MSLCVRVSVSVPGTGIGSRIARRQHRRLRLRRHSTWSCTRSFVLLSLTLTSRSFLHSHSHNIAVCVCVCMSHGLQKSGSYSYKRGRACHRKENGRKSGNLIIELNDDEKTEREGARANRDRRTDGGAHSRAITLQKILPIESNFISVLASRSRQSFPFSQAHMLAEYSSLRTHRR